MVEEILRALIVCSLLLPLTASAQTGVDAEDEPKPHVELELKLPPLPKDANLLQFEPSAASANRFYVDGASILVGTDGIVRYTLVIKSPSGAANVSYEGIWCAMKEQKTYALGRSDGTWSNARTSEWRPIVYKEINRHHAVLFTDYFCAGKFPIRSAADALYRFKHGVPYTGNPRFEVR